ncbi:MAG: alpha/beta hydrolase family esterase [Geminicoccaceae bacterium]
MNETPSGPNLLAATRFVQAGRLTEATALLQRLLRGDPGSHVDAMVETAPSAELDLTPETLEVTAPALKTPAMRAVGTGGGSLPGGTRAAMAQAVMPEALRGFLERLNGNGLEPGLAGLANPTPLADALPDGARFLAGSYGNQAGSRAYKLYVPSTAGTRPLPLVVMLHGCTQSPDDFAAGTRMNQLAEEHGCLVAYPAQSASANISRCWNWFKAEDQQRDAGEPSLIAGITRQIMAEYPVDPRRVYVAGLSAGGAAAAVMAATYPDLYAAVGVHSGLAAGAAKDMPSAFAAMQNGATATSIQPSRSRPQERTVPTIVFHGDLDRTVHPRNGDQVIGQARNATAAGLQATATAQQGQAVGGRRYRRTTHADATGRAMLEHWMIQGAGHAWAGGSPAGSYTDPQGPDASREMLRFFLEHPHPTAPAPQVH